MCFHVCHEYLILLIETIYFYGKSRSHFPPNSHTHTTQLLSFLVFVAREGENENYIFIFNSVIKHSYSAFRIRLVSHSHQTSASFLLLNAYSFNFSPSHFLCFFHGAVFFGFICIYIFLPIIRWFERFLAE